MEGVSGPRTQVVFVWCTESVTQPRQNTCNLLSLSSRPSSHSQPSSQPTLKQLLGSILDLWQSTSGWKEHTWTFRWTSLCELTCLLMEGWKMWHWGKKNADSLFSLIHLLFFFPRCEYDSMFVQDDVILNVDFFFSFSFFKWRSYWTAACTTITTSHYRPLCLAVDHVVCLNKTGSEETKVNKEIMFWPFVVNGVFKTKSAFLENSFLEQLPWKWKCFFFFNVTYLIWNCFIWIYMEI